MEKEQSILAKPSAQQTQGSICCTEQQARETGWENFWQATRCNMLGRHCRALPVTSWDIQPSCHQHAAPATQGGTNPAAQGDRLVSRARDRSLGQQIDLGPGRCAWSADWVHLSNGRVCLCLVMHWMRSEPPDRGGEAHALGQRVAGNRLTVQFTRPATCSHLHELVPWGSTEWAWSQVGCARGCMQQKPHPSFKQWARS